MKNFITVQSAFESSVNSYGKQTATEKWGKATVFESSVNSYGKQT